MEKDEMETMHSNNNNKKIVSDDEKVELETVKKWQD